jgi:hypothetical protein
MRSRIRRHLGSLLSPPVAPAKTFDAAAANKTLRALLVPPAASATADASTTVPPEFSPHQYVILLLHIAAELEHVLMVEYLYAAYSLGGPQVPPEHEAKVAQWQEVILGIAKEEMGHLMTVQNILRCLGGPLNLDREDYPWDSEFTPFPFHLEPLVLPSLARFIFAESPAAWSGDEADRIREIARQGIDCEVKLHRVGELYDLLGRLIRDPNIIPDRDFRASTYPFQANWDEWGRGYQRGERGNAMGGAIAGTPDVLLIPVASRDDALAAIEAIATQGEAVPDADPEAPSHFARFLKIFDEFPENEKGWSPAREAPTDPYVSTDLTGDGVPAPREEGTPIEHPEARLWAHLFNVRYQLLLTCLLHTFDFPSNLAESSQMTPRGLLIHATFGEMYNLRAIAMMLVQTPLASGKGRRVAGAPFQMPYTLELPLDDVDRWRVHLDLFQASSRLIDGLLSLAPKERHRYLLSLREADERSSAAIATILNCQSRPRVQGVARG